MAGRMHQSLRPLPSTTGNIATGGVPITTSSRTASRVSNRVNGVKALGAGADSGIVLNERLGAADLGVTHLLAVLALNTRVCNKISAQRLSRIIVENSQSRGLGQSLGVCPYSSQLRHWTFSRLRGFSHSLAM